VLQVETLIEIGGVVATLRISWSYATGGGGLTVDQAAAVALAVVMSGRTLVQAARRYWQRHHRLQPDLEFPPDRLVVFLYSIIRTTVPYRRNIFHYRTS